MENLFSEFGIFVSTYGLAALKLLGIMVGITLSLFKIKKWISDADVEKTQSVVGGILRDHCPMAHKEIIDSVNELRADIKLSNPNGQLNEILAVVKKLAKR